MICIFVRFYSRFDIILRDIYYIFKIFSKFRNNIIIIITHFDELTGNFYCPPNKSPKEEIECHIQNIKKIIIKKFEISNILFTELKTDYKEIYKILEIIKNKMINIPKLMITYRFFLSSLYDEGDEELYEERNKFIKEFEESLIIFHKEFNKAKDSDLKRAIYFALKSYKESLIEKYVDVIKKKKEYTDEIIANLILFNNSIFYMFNNFKTIIEKEINIKIGNNKNKNCNEFRKCPYCGLVWMQTQGCNDVFCGERGLTKDINFGIYKNYIVKFENKKIIINYEEINNNSGFRGNGPRIIGLKEEEEEKNISLRNYGKQEIKLLGCGTALKWDEMEDVTDSVLYFLKEMPISDYDSDVIKIAERIYREEF